MFLNNLLICTVSCKLTVIWCYTYKLEKKKTKWKRYSQTVLYITWSTAYINSKRNKFSFNWINKKMKWNKRGEETYRASTLWFWRSGHSRSDVCDRSYGDRACWHDDFGPNSDTLIKLVTLETHLTSLRPIFLNWKMYSFLGPLILTTNHITTKLQTKSLLQYDSTYEYICIHVRTRSHTIWSQRV